VLICGVTKDVYRVLRDSGMVEVLGKDNIFPASPSNPNLATRNALKRAQQILGTTEAQVKIFVDAARGRERQTQAADALAKETLPGRRTASVPPRMAISTSRPSS
jgi:hypothetical protein